MKRDNVNYLLVGSFVLFMALVLLYALYRITGHSAKGDTYFTHFSNVAGIKEGSIVTYEGYEVGNVALVEPEERELRTSFRITLNLRKPLKIPVDSLALIATPGLLSAPLVEIKEGKSRDMLAAGAYYVLGGVLDAARPTYVDYGYGSDLGDLGNTAGRVLPPGCMSRARCGSTRV